MYIPSPDKVSVNIELSEVDLRPDARPHSAEDIAKLAKSMAMRQLQNIIVCKENGRYEVIAGVGRVLAARLLKKDTIKADVYDILAESQKLSIMFDENEDRENPPALYQAKLVQAMKTEDNHPGRTQQQLADALGKDQTTISKYLSLQSLSPKIWADMNMFINLAIRHFVQLLRIKNEDEQWKVAKVTVQRELSASQLESLIDQKLGVKPTAKMGRPKDRKSLGAEGFEVTRKKDNLMIRAVLTTAADLDAFLSKLRAEILRLRVAPAPVPTPEPVALSQATVSTPAPLHIPETLPTPDEVRELLKADG